MAWGNHMVITSIYSFLHFWGEKMQFAALQDGCYFDRKEFAFSPKRN